MSRLEELFRASRARRKATGAGGASIGFIRFVGSASISHGPTPRLPSEIEGGVWTGGRHTRGAGFESDAHKYNLAALDGWRVFRFTGAMVQERRGDFYRDSGIEGGSVMPMETDNPRCDQAVDQGIRADDGPGIG
ncbi:hypothetical protein L0Z13_11335 [Burkholderia multivorans]|uniref:hypothetical protein n=1 Tax=Burkholderia multivorans TaxID=87883 RepID=UPI002019DB6F|nr:hypothetical protein [Burkholderia multivorans]UQO04943.1 hypothetical protein L0Z13_11335 [Burkholderia multivorans]